MAARQLWAIPFGALIVFATTLSIDRWTAAAEGRPGLLSPLMPSEDQPTSPELERFKKEFAEAAGILEYHHEVYERIGARRWEQEVRPTIAARLLRKMAEDTGILVPTDAQIIDWAKTNPASVRGVLEGYLRGGSGR
jgi:hypothetical protein